MSAFLRFVPLDAIPPEQEIARALGGSPDLTVYIIAGVVAAAAAVLAIFYIIRRRGGRK